MEINDYVAECLDKLIKFDGVTLGVEGITDDNEKFFVNFDVDINTVFSFLSFKDYEYTHGTYSVNENDRFVLDSLFDALMNLKNSTYKYNGNNLKLYVPGEKENVYLDINLVNEEYIITGYGKAKKMEGKEPLRVVLYNHDNAKYDDFPETKPDENFDSCYYSFI